MRPPLNGRIVGQLGGIVDEQGRDVAAAFGAWLAEVEAESIPQDIVAVNLGLFETTDGYTAYLAGSRDYDPEDDSWACQEHFVPKSKYFPLTSTFAGLPWEEVQAAYHRLLASYLADHPLSQLHRLAAVTVGFDDGDLSRVLWSDAAQPGRR